MLLNERDSYPRPVSDYLALQFPSPFPERPYVILCMVASADGKARAGPTEGPISSQTDKLVLQTLRVHADAILNGAGTARASGVNPSIRDAGLRGIRLRAGRPEKPLQAILSGSASISPSSSFLRRRSFQVVIFVHESAPPERIAALLATGVAVELLPAGPATATELTRCLHIDYGVNLLLLEGGPTVNSQFFHEGLIDEVFLTLAPHIVDGRGALTAVEGDAFTHETMPALDLVSAYPNLGTSEVFVRWRVRH
jgi:2,5-diamino-6-(ribosylamino)-4(3H)-pyrimidinone 5'-phosphate reductase